MRFFSLILLVVIFGCKENKEPQSNANDSRILALPAYAKNWEAALPTSADSNQLQFQLAITYDSIGNHSKALMYLNKLLGKDSSNYGLWYTKAQFTERAKDTVGAITNYLRAAAIYPSADALLGAGNLYAETGNNRALKITNEILGSRLGSETDAHAYFIAGVYFARTSDTLQAIQALDKCITNNHTYMEAYIEKGLVYFDNKQYVKALEIFRFASTVNTLYADNYYYMGRCYELMEKTDSAVQKFEQAVSLDANMVEATQALQRLKK